MYGDMVIYGDIYYSQCSPVVSCLKKKDNKKDNSVYKWVYSENCGNTVCVCETLVNHTHSSCDGTCGHSTTEKLTLSIHKYTT